MVVVVAVAVAIVVAVSPFCHASFGLLVKMAPANLKMVPRLFTNDISSFNDSTYHTHMVIMQAHEVQMCYNIWGPVKNKNRTPVCHGQTCGHRAIAYTVLA